MNDYEEVLACIPYGVESAVSRTYLSATLGMTDRAVRKAIQSARTAGNIIINDQSGCGYYQSDDIDQIEKQYRLNKSRAMSILVQQKHLRKRLKEAGREV